MDTREQDGTFDLFGIIQHHACWIAACGPIEHASTCANGPFPSQDTAKQLVLFLVCEGGALYKSILTTFVEVTSCLS